MEEASLAVTQFLVRLIFPLGVVASCVGLVTIGVAVFQPKKDGRGGRITLRGNDRGDRSPIAERIAVGLCAPVSLLGLIIAFQSLRLRNPSDGPYRPLSVILVLAIVVTGLPAILWKTRLRWAAEGLATIALAVASTIAGFSIGFIFVPLTVLMIWICVQHLREVDKSSMSERASSG